MGGGSGLRGRRRGGEDTVDGMRRPGKFSGRNGKVWSLEGKMSLICIPSMRIEITIAKNGIRGSREGVQNLTQTVQIPIHYYTNLHIIAKADFRNGEDDG